MPSSCDSSAWKRWASLTTGLPRWRASALDCCGASAAFTVNRSGLIIAPGLRATFVPAERCRIGRVQVKTVRSCAPPPSIDAGAPAVSCSGRPTLSRNPAVLARSLVLLLALTAPALAQAPRITPAGDPTVKDDTIYRLAVNAADHADDDYVYLLDDGAVRLEADGRGSRTYRQVVQIFTREPAATWGEQSRSEEHTSELQSQSNLVCRLLLEKKKT